MMALSQIVTTQNMSWFLHAVNAWGAIVIAVGGGVLVWSLKQSGSLAGLLEDAGLAAAAGAAGKSIITAPPGEKTTPPAAPKPAEPPIEGVPEIPIEGA
jgi:hypothetical protein